MKRLYFQLIELLIILFFFWIPSDRTIVEDHTVRLCDEVPLSFCYYRSTDQKEVTKLINQVKS